MMGFFRKIKLSLYIYLDSPCLLPVYLLCKVLGVFGGLQIKAYCSLH